MKQAKKPEQAKTIPATKPIVDEHDHARVVAPAEEPERARSPQSRTRRARRRS